MDLLPDAAASQERLELPILGSATELEKRNLFAFDEMDFNVFSRRDWARFHESHPSELTGSIFLTAISPTASRST